MSLITHKITAFFIFLLLLISSISVTINASAQEKKGQKDRQADIFVKESFGLSDNNKTKIRHLKKDERPKPTRPQVEIVYLK